MAIYSLFFSLEAWQICILGFDLLCTLLQLQQVVDSFIIFASQQNIDLPSSHASLGSALSLEMPWTMFSPSKIRMVPFPTREYTDDEFQSIVKSVMGLLYVSPLFVHICMVFEYLYDSNDCILVEQVPSGISVSNLPAYQLLCLWEGCFGFYTLRILKNRADMRCCFSTKSCFLSLLTWDFFWACRSRK